MLALEGTKVLDFTRNAPGMFCTMILGDMGAEVLMVERPVADQRAIYERAAGRLSSAEEDQKRAAYNALQRNKESMALNLKEPEAQQIFYKLAESADVVVEGFRPGVMDRLGVGYERVREINPRIVYCSISGFGQDGPYSNMVGHDINYISLAGALGLTGESEEASPAIPLNLLADYAGGGLCGSVAILSALLAREKTGRGQYLDIAMTEGVLYMLAGFLSAYLGQGTLPRRGGSRLNGGSPDYNIYKTKDGKYFTIAALEPWFWENLCRALEREDLVPHQQASGQQRDEISQFLKETFLTCTRDEWFDLLKDRDISVGKVYSLKEALADPQVVHRGMVVEVEAPGMPGGAVSQVGMPHPAVGNAWESPLRRLGNRPPHRPGPGRPGLYSGAGKGPAAAWGRGVVNLPPPHAVHLECDMMENQSSSEFQSYNPLVRETWNQIAGFWDELMADEGNVFYRHLVGPAQERLLELVQGELVLEIACGNGQFTRRLAALGARVIATDLSEKHIEAARTEEHVERIEYAVLDATDVEQLMSLGKARFDAAVCTMALFDMASIEPLFSSLSRLLKPRGRFVFSILHPCFNSVPDLQMVAEKQLQGAIVTEYSLKMSRYITPAVYDNPAAPGQPVNSYVFHRPLSVIFNAGFSTGFVVDGIEEPVFGDEVPARGALGWDDFRDIPPVLAVRMRLSS